jgi:hypothetical protein
VTSLRELTLYSRQGCTLCEDMVGQLRELEGELSSFRLSIIDISGDSQLELRFGWDIPVLFCGDQEVCRHFLDLQALRFHLARD